MMQFDLDDLMEYLIVTDQVDEFFGLKTEEDEEKEDQEEDSVGYSK